MDAKRKQTGDWLNHVEHQLPSMASGEEIPIPQQGILGILIWNSSKQRPQIVQLPLHGQPLYDSWNEVLSVTWWMPLPTFSDTDPDDWFKYPVDKPAFGDWVLAWSSSRFYVCRFSDDGFSCSEGASSVRLGRLYGVVIWWPLPKIPS